jgi:hypothetical protein
VGHLKWDGPESEFDMLQFFKQIADLLQQSLAYLELDEGYDPQEIREVELQILSRGQYGETWLVTFPEIKVEYFASDWSHGSGKADWLFSR